MKYEYDTIRLYDHEPTGISDSLCRYYRNELRRFYPSQVDDTFKWFEQFNDKQLRDIGLIRILYDGVGNVKTESIETIHQRVIISHQVQFMIHIDLVIRTDQPGDIE